MNYEAWNPPSELPPHPDVYEVKDFESSSEECYAYWNGERFGWRAFSRAFSGLTGAGLAEKAVRRRGDNTNLPLLTHWRFTPHGKHYYLYHLRGLVERLIKAVRP